MISIGNKYLTKGGREVKILYTDLKGDFPVIGVIEDQLFFYTKEGSNSSSYSMDDIVEPYADFKIDDKVLVSDKYSPIKRKSHFAGVNSEGKPMAFMNGETSWTTTTPPCSWGTCEKAENQ